MRRHRPRPARPPLAVLVAVIALALGDAWAAAVPRAEGGALERLTGVPEIAWSALFYGSMATILALALLASPLLSRRLTLAFCFYMLAAIGLVLSSEGQVLRLFAPDDRALVPRLDTVLAIAFHVALLNFSRTIFDTREFHPRFDRVLRAMFLLGTVLAIAALSFDVPRQPWFLALEGVVYYGVPPLHLITAVLAVRDGRRGTLPLLLTSGLLVLVVLYLAVDASPPSDIWLRSALARLLITLEAIAFAVAMVLRVLGIRADRDRAVRDELAATREKLRLSDALREREIAYERVRRQADRRRDRLASVSHDILQPLTSLRTALGDVHRAEEGQLRQMHEAFDYLERLATGGLRGGESTGHRPADDGGEAFPLSAVTDNVVAMFEDEAASKGLELQYRSTDATVETAPVELMRAVSNLLSNAIKYTDEGHVELRCEPMEDGVRITVRDTGRGMDERELARCLRRHERGEASTGAGLGLDIVRATCERWGYRFDIRSRAGTGTVATLTLPLRPALPPTERGISPIPEAGRAL